MIAMSGEASGHQASGRLSNLPSARQLDTATEDIAHTSAPTAPTRVLCSTPLPDCVFFCPQWNAKAARWEQNWQSPSAAYLVLSAHTWPLRAHSGGWGLSTSSEPQFLMMVAAVGLVGPARLGRGHPRRSLGGTATQLPTLVPGTGARGPSSLGSLRTNWLQWPSLGPRWCPLCKGQCQLRGGSVPGRVCSP